MFKYFLLPSSPANQIWSGPSFIFKRTIDNCSFSHVPKHMPYTHTSYYKLSLNFFSFNICYTKCHNQNSYVKVSSLLSSHKYHHRYSYKYVLWPTWFVKTLTNVFYFTCVFICMKKPLRIISYKPTIQSKKIKK